MKKLFKKIIIGSLIGLPLVSNAQFLLPFPFNYGVTQPSVQKIGIGNFPTNASVQAKLHINEFLLANNPATNGLMFRTDGNNNTDNSWSIYTGVNTNSLTEKFRLYVPANSTNAVLQTQQPNSRILFNTNGVINRMLITDGGIGSFGGRIAIGNNLPSGFIPRSRLHLHQTDGNVRIQFTRNNVGSFASDGLQIGIKGAFNNPLNPYHAYINHKEDAPLKIYTNNSERIHINAIDTTTINGFNSIVTTGYVGIGSNSSTLWNTTGPYTLLHLNGTDNIPSTGASGYLPWMRTGITLTDSSDLSYMGLRKVAGTANVTETTILWSNDLAAGQEDDFVLRFARADIPPNTFIDTTNFNSYNDLDGRHIARFTGKGNMGLGPTFGLGNPAYITPQSMIHMSKTDYRDVWLQATNRGGTGETAGDGLRIGITDTGVAHIIQQEQLPLIFYTDSIENIRIEPDSASTLSGNFGKVGIGDWTTAQNIANPIDAKLDIDGDLRIRTVTKDTNNSRLVLVIDSTDHNRVHWLNLDSISSNVTASNGISVDSGIVKLGVPCRDTAGNVNQAAILANALTQDRVVAFRNHHLWFASLNSDSAGVGIGGQPAFAPFCETGNTVEISANNKNKKYGNTNASGLRFTKLLSTSPVTPDSLYGIDPTKVLTVDSAGDVVLVNAKAATDAFNGTSIDAGRVQLGNDVGLTTAQLVNDREIPMNNNNIFLTDPATLTQGENRVQIGTFGPVGLADFSKFIAANNTPTSTPNRVIGVTGAASDQIPAVPPAANPLYINNISNTIRVGVLGLGYETLSSTTQAQYGVGMSSLGISGNRGAYGVIAKSFSTNVTTISAGATGLAIGEARIMSGLEGYANNSASIANRTFGVKGIANTQVVAGSEAYGGWFRANNADNSVGVYAEGLNAAGYFNGDVFSTTGYFIVPSDVNLKQNIQTLDSALSIIDQLSPKTYEFNPSAHPATNFASGTQFGLIAQDVEAILPELVNDGMLQAELDSIGNVISPSMDIKTLNYTGLIPILVQGSKELIEINRTQDSIIQDLNNRLLEMEDCLGNTGICNGGGNGQGNGNGNGNGNKMSDGQTIELTNLNAIILDQNLPNPFAENTVITYSIPDDVMEVTLMFYDMNGRIIKQVEIEDRGESKLTVYGNNLKNGIYTYSLIADGKLIATKKMVKQ